jgi:hypothetical protein
MGLEDAWIESGDGTEDEPALPIWGPVDNFRAAQPSALQWATGTALVAAATALSGCTQAEIERLATDWRNVIMDGGRRA